MPLPALQTLANVAYPVLPQGIHDANVADLEARFVTPFPQSHRRQQILNEFRMFRASLSAEIPIRAEYLDGSFVTGKPDPKDLDVSFWLSPDDLDALGPVAAANVANLFNTAKSRRLDVYVVPDCPQGHPRYRDFEMMMWTEHYWSRCRDASGLMLSPHQYRKGFVRMIP